MEIKRLLEHRRAIKKKKPRFLRKDWHKISNLGLRRENKQVWRKPKGRHNKLREKKKSHGKNPSVGYMSPRLIRGTIEGLIPMLVKNEKDLEKVGKGGIGIIAKVGMKKKIAIVKKAEEMGVSLLINRKKFLKKAEKIIAEISKKKETGTEKTKKEEVKTEEKKQ